MGKKLKQWLFNTVFKEEIEEYKDIIKELSKDLESELLDNIRNMRELKESNDMNKLYEEEINKLEKENRIMTLIIGGLRVYDR